MPRWEYRMTEQTLDRSKDGTGKSLNSQGRQGWELVGVYYPHHDKIRFVFKRRIDEEQ